MIGWNAANYGSVSLLRQKISMRNSAPERTSATVAGQMSEKISPNIAAPRSDSGETDAASVVTAALPTENDLNRSLENIVRMEVQYPGTRPAFPFADVKQALKFDDLAGVRKSLSPDLTDDANRRADDFINVEESKSPAEIMNETKCQTCARRKYQDGSDDPGVSFKTPTKMNPEQAATAVRGHEQEHVVRERAEATRENRKVISQSVTIHTDICPECGRVYISGGVTRTVTAADNDNLNNRENEADKLSAPGTFEATA